MRAFARLILAAAALASSSVADSWRPPNVLASLAISEVDPRTVSDPDFLRQNDPGAWRGLSVKSIAFREGATDWHLWRIHNREHPDGPLWVVPHDNENAAFAAGMTALRSWGGTMVVVDTGGSRFNQAVDPNRNFREELPLYAGAILADLAATPQLIVALHTNAPGFDASLSTCPIAGTGTGSGDISIRLCTARMLPSAAPVPRWPYEDEDSLILVPFLASRLPSTAYCGQRLKREGYNVMFERVAATDGSLSNYATLHGLRYFNIETRDRGDSPEGIAEARNRMIAMLDATMERCSDAPAARLSAP